MNHTYTVEQLESGALLLTCPKCGRVIVVQWEPYNKVVEVRGDAHVHHRFNVPGVTMGVEVTKSGG